MAEVGRAGEGVLIDVEGEILLGLGREAGGEDKKRAFHTSQLCTPWAKP